MDLIHVSLQKKSNQTFPELLTADLTRAEGTTYICHSPIKQLGSYKTTTNLINTEHFFLPVFIQSS